LQDSRLLRLLEFYARPEGIPNKPDGAEHTSGRR
jgi:hypothetical protein